MKMRLLIAVVLLAGSVGLTGWLGWRWYSTPAPPEIAADGAQPELVELIEKAREDVRREPRSGEAWGKLAMILAVNGFAAQAILCYAHAERFDPTTARWPYLRGLEILKSNPHHAIPLLRRALSVARTVEERSAILSQLALLLVEDGELDEARQHVGALREMEGESPRVNYIRALFAIAGDDKDTARKHLNAVVQTPFFRKKALSLLATLSTGDEKEMLASRQRAASLPDDRPWPDPFLADRQSLKMNRLEWYEPIQRLIAENRREEAIQSLRRLAAEAPDDKVFYLLGFTLYELRRYDQAAEAFGQATRFDDKNVKAHFFLGESLLRAAEQRAREPGGRESAKEMFGQAVLALDRALALQLDFGSAHLARGQALGHLGRSGEAIRALRQALVCQPEVVETHVALGNALAEAGLIPEALEHLENAVKLARPGDNRPRDMLRKWQNKSERSSSQAK